MQPLSFELRSIPRAVAPETKIRFSLPQGSWTSIVVFNRVGEEVSTLLEGEYLQPGAYTIPFKGENLPPGSYTVRVQTALGAKLAKFMLVK